MKLTEEDVKFQFITPSIESSGWQKEQFRMEYFFTDGQVIVRGNHHKRGKRKKADYILFRKNSRIPIALIEAKTLDHSVGSGMQQALEYAKLLDIPFVYSSNGKGFLEHDRLKGTEKEISLQESPLNGLHNRPAHIQPYQGDNLLNHGLIQNPAHIGYLA